MNTQPTQNKSTSQPPGKKPEIKCPHCGEQVRIGVVRCWNCQAFMRADIEEKYQEMISQERPVIYSDIADNLEEFELQPVAEAVTYSDDEDGDFDLGDDVALYADDDDFELMKEEKDAVIKAAPGLRAREEQARKAKSSQGDSSSNAEQSGYEIAQPASDAAEGETSSTSSPTDGDDSAVDHSVATGGDALWEIAKNESLSGSKPMKKTKNISVRPGSILVHCPHGHRIEVQERHRGRMGRCPKCKSQFTVPVQTLTQEGKQAEGEGETGEIQAPDRHFADLQLHAVDPGKLKLKPGSLAKSYLKIDVCLGKEGLLLSPLSKKGGMFGGSAKPEDLRKELLESLAAAHDLKNAPGEQNHLFSLDDLKEMAVVHPTAYAHESILGGVNVFGPGIIAVRIPKRADDQLEFLVLSLSQFRRFHQQIQTECGVDLNYETDQIPSDDKTTPALCHYTDEPIKYIGNLEFYENDSEFELDLVGWKCQACGLTVSEDGRKKENIGGKNAKAIAKAKCPKCENAFGKNPLYAIKKIEQPATEVEGEE